MAQEPVVLRLPKGQVHPVALQFRSREGGRSLLTHSWKFFDHEAQRLQLIGALRDHFATCGLESLPKHHHLSLSEVAVWLHLGLPRQFTPCSFFCFVTGALVLFVYLLQSLSWDAPRLDCCSTKSCCYILAGHSRTKVWAVILRPTECWSLIDLPIGSIYGYLDLDVFNYGKCRRIYQFDGYFGLLSPSTIALKIQLRNEFGHTVLRIQYSFIGHPPHSQKGDIGSGNPIAPQGFPWRLCNNPSLYCLSRLGITHRTLGITVPANGASIRTTLVVWFVQGYSHKIRSKNTVMFMLYLPTFGYMDGWFVWSMLVNALVNMPFVHIESHIYICLHEWLMFMVHVGTGIFQRHEFYEQVLKSRSFWWILVPKGSWYVLRKGLTLQSYCWDGIGTIKPTRIGKGMDP